MENRKIYITLASVALVVLVAFAIAGRWPGRPGEAPEPGTPGQPGQQASSTLPATLRMEVVTVASTTGSIEIHAEYPTFPDDRALSDEVAAYAKGAIAQFVENVEENDRARQETSGGLDQAEFVYSLGLTWEPAQLNARYVSFLMRLDAFEGGANLRQEARAFNWDMQAGRAVTLADIFPDEPAYPQRISTYVRQVLTDSLDESFAEFIEDGTQPTLSNFAWFTFNDDTVTFVFPKYQVAPGVAGEQEVSMPRQMPGLW